MKYRGYTYDSDVNFICSSYAGPELGSPQPHKGSHMSIILVEWDLMASSNFHCWNKKCTCYTYK